MSVDSVQFIYPAQDARTGQDSVYQPTADALAAAGAGGGAFSFKDVLDIVNPLQQLPIIGSIYRALSGDTISPASQIAGGTLYGGPLGFVLSALGEGISGGQGGLGDTVMSMLNGGANGNGAGSQYAAAQYQKTQSLS